MRPWRRSVSSREPSGCGPSTPSGREILRDAGVAVEPLADRPAVLAAVAPWADEADLLRLDTAVSRLKVELGVSAADVAADDGAGPVARAFVAYEAAVAASGGLDFDDLILRAIARARTATPTCSPAGAVAAGSCSSTRSRTSTAHSSGSPCCWPPRRTGSSSSVTTTSRSTAGDSPTSGGSSGSRTLLPGLRRVDLEVNYRCPRQVVERAVRLVEHNGERFAKAIRAGPAATGRLVLAPDPSDETVRLERAIRTWPDDGSTRAVLARTNRELLPAVVVALRLGLPFRAPRIDLLLDSPIVDDLLARAGEAAADGEPLLITLGRVRAGVRRRPRRRAESPRPSSAGRSATRTWRPSPRPSRETRAALADLRRDDAPLTLATAHATKGLEFDHVDRRSGWRPAASRAPGGQPGRGPGPRVRGGTSPRLCRVDPGASLAHAPLRPGGPLPVPARGVQPGRARAQPRARLSSRMSRSIESRNGSVRASGRTSRIESLTP